MREVYSLVLACKNWEAEFEVVVEFRWCISTLGTAFGYYNWKNEQNIDRPCVLGPIKIKVILSLLIEAPSKLRHIHDMDNPVQRVKGNCKGLASYS